MNDKYFNDFKIELRDQRLTEMLTYVAEKSFTVVERFSG